MIKRLAMVLAILAVVLAPSVARAQSSADLVVADLDTFWSQQLAERGIAYTSPRFEIVDGYGQDLCGFLDAYDSIGAYCFTSSTLTLSTAFVDPDDIASILPILSHEFGHHIQNLTDTGVTTSLEAELQADCFGGAFIRYAEEQGWISPAIAAMAMQLTQVSGDIWWLDPSEPGVHGNGGDRVLAYWSGYNGGLSACGL